MLERGAANICYVGQLVGGGGEYTHCHNKTQTLAGQVGGGGGYAAGQGGGGVNLVQPPSGWSSWLTFPHPLLVGPTLP